MPRPKIDLGEEWRKSIAATLEPRLAEELAERALTETELLARSMKILGVDRSPGELIASLKKMYKLQFRESLSDRTAMKAVLHDLKKSVEVAEAKLLEKGIRVTPRKFQFGKDFVGRIFYSNESQLHQKVREILAKRSEAVASQLLQRLDSKGYVRLKELAFQPRAINLAKELLLDVGLAEVKGNLLVSPGFDPATLQLEAVSVKASSFATFFEKQGFSVSAPYTAGCWVVGEAGPKVVRLVFGAMAFDKKTRQIHVADHSNRQADVSRLRRLREKAVEWGLPITLHFFAPDFTPTAEKYAAKLGIQLHKTI